MRSFLLFSVVFLSSPTFAQDDFENDLPCITKQNLNSLEDVFQDDIIFLQLLNFEVLEDQLFAVHYFIQYQNNFETRNYKLTKIYRLNKSFNEFDLSSEISENFEFMGLRWDQISN